MEGVATDGVTVIDDFAPMGLVNATVATWPDATWPHWHKYSDGTALKYTTKDPERITTPCKILIQRMAELECGNNLFPDLDLHGAGMHWIPEGGWLSPHYDGEIHPLTGWFRRRNAVLFLTSCSGGELVVAGDSITPKPGTVVVFDSNRLHHVTRVTRGDRKTLSLFWWSLDGEGVIETAKFVEWDLDDS